MEAGLHTYTDLASTWNHGPKLTFPTPSSKVTTVGHNVHFAKVSVFAPGVLALEGGPVDDTQALPGPPQQDNPWSLVIWLLSGFNERASRQRNVQLETSTLGLGPTHHLTQLTTNTANGCYSGIWVVVRLRLEKPQGSTQWSSSDRKSVVFWQQEVCNQATLQQEVLVPLVIWKRDQYSLSFLERHSRVQPP